MCYDCKHNSFSYDLENDDDPAEADMVPICDDCGHDLSTPCIELDGGA